MFGSLLTRPYRLATRGAELTVRGTLHAVDLAGEAITAVALRVVGRSRNGDGHEMTPVTDTPTDMHAPPDTDSAPDMDTTPDIDTAPDTRTTEPPSGPDAPLGQEARPSAEGPPAPEPPSAERVLNAEKPSSTPEPPSAARRLAAETRDVQPAPPTPAEPAHVSEEPELVEEFAEPGAEEGAGAQPRIMEPWPSYDEMKAADIIARVASASREELAAVELYELAGRNRKSVVAAAQRALKRASPPR